MLELKARAKGNWGFSRLEPILDFRILSQKMYFIIIERFYKNLPFCIKQNFCDVTLRLCRAPEGRTSTYGDPCIQSPLWLLCILCIQQRKNLT